MSVLTVLFFILKLLLLLLKIIGILLLIVILLAALILLVPIRYRFEANVPEEKSSSNGSVTISWFAFLLRANAAYQEGKFQYFVKVFGYQILGNEPSFLKKQEEKEAKKKEKAKRKKEEQSENKVDQKEETSDKAPSVLEKPVEETEKKESTNTEPAQKRKEQKNEKDSAKKQEETPKTIKKRQKSEESFAEDLEDDEDDDTEDSEGIRKRVQKLIRTIKEKWEEYHMRENLPFFKEIIWRTLRHILPRKLQGNVSFGLENPETMGYVTAVMAMMYPAYGKHFSFKPYFYGAPLLADCRGRGRIRLGFLLYIGIRLLLNKDVRKIIFS